MAFNPAGAPIGSHYLFYGISQAGQSLGRGLELMKQRHQQAKGADQYGIATGAFTKEEASAMSLEQKKAGIATHEYKQQQEDRQRAYEASLAAGALQVRQLGLQVAQGFRDKERLILEGSRDMRAAAAAKSSAALAEEGQRLTAARDAVAKTQTEQLVSSSKQAQEQQAAIFKASEDQREAQVRFGKELTGNVAPWQRLIGQATGKEFDPPELNERGILEAANRAGYRLSESFMEAIHKEEKGRFKPTIETLKWKDHEFPVLVTSSNSAIPLQVPGAGGADRPPEVIDSQGVRWWKDAKGNYHTLPAGAKLSPEENSELYDLDKNGVLDPREGINAQIGARGNVIVGRPYRKDGSTNAPSARPAAPAGRTNAPAFDPTDPLGIRPR